MGRRSASSILQFSAPPVLPSAWAIEASAFLLQPGSCFLQALLRLLKSLHPVVTPVSVIF